MMMKSGLQRRKEIVERRRLRARISKRMSVEPWREPDRVPAGAVPAEQEKLLHDRSWGLRPRFYADKRFTCVECGTAEVWTAADQKWWYEEAKGKIATRAKRCRACRRSGRLLRSQERRIHVEGMIAKHGLEGAARRLCLTVTALQRMRARSSD
jgi:Probable zinc-ribbon domain